MVDDLGRERYEDFYVGYFDMKGNPIFPTTLLDAVLIRKLMRMANSNSLIDLEEAKLKYKLRIKKSNVNGQDVQIVEITNVTEFFQQVTTACVDEVTHLNNRKIARNLFMQYIESAYRREQDFAVILADLDGFKGINDTYGHVNGDLVLSEVSRILFCSTRQERNREQDIVARIGGDEFMIIMKNAPFEIAEDRAERIRSNVENHKVTLFNELDFVKIISPGTLSMGLYHVSAEELKDFYDKGYTTDEIRTLIIDRTDTALYSSKNNGKNRVTVYRSDRLKTLEKSK